MAGYESEDPMANRPYFYLKLLALLFLASCCRVCAAENEPATDMRSSVLAAIAQQRPQVVIPPGTYRLGPQGNDGVILTLRHARNLEIVTDGVTLVCTKRIRAIMFDDCDHVTLRGLTVDYDPLTFTQGTVVAVADDVGWMDVKLDAGYPQVLNDRIVICDPKTRFHKYGINHTWGTKASWKEPGIVRISLKDVARHVDLGDPVALSGGPDGGAAHAITIENRSSAITLKNVTLHCAPGMGIIESGSDVGVTLSGCRIVPGPKPAGATEERLLTTSWDGIQCKPARVGAQVEDCVIERCGDDSWSVPSTDFEVYQRKGAKLIISQPDANLLVGDCLMDRSNDVAKVQSMREIHLDTTTLDAQSLKTVQQSGPGISVACEVTLDKELPVGPGQWLYNPSCRSKGFVFRNNRIYSQGRGALVKVSDGMIEGNVFRGGDKAIVVNPETLSDAGPCDNLIIRNNVIRATGYHQAMPWSDEAGAVCISKGISSEIMFHNILISGNTFDSIDGLNLLISSAQGVVVRDNRFLNTHATDPGRHNGADRGIDATAVIMVTHSKEVRFEGNVIEKMGPFAKHAVVTDPSDSAVEVTDTGVRVDQTR
jgi:hypothetical protein